MTITAAQIKALREKTGMGFMECKKALVENDGDEQKAIVYLRERGMSRASKKAERSAGEGTVSVKVSDDCKKGVLVELNCETDFVSSSADFKAFLAEITTLALDNNCKSADELKPIKMSDGNTVESNLTNLIAKIGENIKLRRVAYLSTTDGIIAGYSHFTSKLGSLVDVEGSTSDKAKEVAKEIAIHVAACSPKYLNPESVDATELNQEKELARKHLLEQGKPENMIDKILVGQMNKFYSEVCLLNQPFVKDQKISVSDYLKGSGEALSVKTYTRFQLGN